MNICKHCGEVDQEKFNKYNKSRCKLCINEKRNQYNKNNYTTKHKKSKPGPKPQLKNTNNEIISKTVSIKKRLWILIDAYCSTHNVSRGSLITKFLEPWLEKK